MADIRLDFSVDLKDLDRARKTFESLTDEEKRAVTAMSQFDKETQKATTNANKGFQTLKNTLIQVATVAAFTQLVKSIISVTSRYEDLKSTLTTVEQSAAKAEKVFARLNDLAAQTPFSVEEWTESYIKLRNRGIEPTTEELTALGDLAASQGKSIDQVTEATLDALTGETERLKEFGIRASKSGDQITLAFKGVETTVALTNDAVKAALVSFGQMDGVAGGMAARSQTLSGTWSTLKDNASQLAAGIGNLLLPGLKAVVNITTDVIQGISRWLGISKDLNGQIQAEALSYNTLFIKLKSYNSALAAGAKNQEEDRILRQNRAKTIDEINKAYGDYLPNLITEKTSLSDINKLQETGLRLLRQEIIIKSRRKQLTELTEKATEAEQKYREGLADLQTGNYYLYSDQDFKAEVRRRKDVFDSYTKSIQNVQNSMAKQEMRYEEMLERSGVGQARREKERKIEEQKKLAEQQKAAEEQAKTNQKLLEKQAQDRIKFIEETRQMELDVAAGDDALAQLALKHQREIAELEKQGRELGLTQQAIDARLLVLADSYSAQRAKILAKTTDDVKQVKDDTDAIFAEIEQNGREPIPITFEVDIPTAKKSFNDVIAEVQDFITKFGGYFDQGLDAVGSFFDAQTERSNQYYEGLQAQQQAAIDRQLEDIAFLQEAESTASGARKDNLQQEISIRNAQVENERVRLAQLEEAQKQAQRRAAARQKALDIFAATVSAARAVISQLAATPLPIGAPLVALAAATGAAQVAAIAAQPLPQFRHGGPVGPLGKGVGTVGAGGFLSGPLHGSGGIPIEAEGGEWIFSREKTRQFRPLFEAIQNDKLKALPSGEGLGGAALQGLTTELKALRKDMSQLQQVHVHADGNGLHTFVQRGTTRTKYLNQRYRS